MTATLAMLSAIRCVRMSDAAVAACSVSTGTVRQKNPGVMSVGVALSSVVSVVLVAEGEMITVWVPIAAPNAAIARGEPRGPMIAGTWSVLTRYRVIAVVASTSFSMSPAFGV